MRSDWPTVRLGDLIEIKHGWPFKSELFSTEKLDNGIVVAIGNFRYTGGFRFEETAAKGYLGTYPAEYVLSPGDVLLVMTCQTPGGEILGVPARIPDDGNTYLHNQRLGKVVVNRSDLVRLDYLYWMFLSPDFNRHLVATASGTKILHTSPSRICDYQFILPPLSVQEGVSSTLSALEDRTDTLRSMNKTLESISQTIFRSWFIDFDPVRVKAEGRDPEGMDAETAALFPNEFEESHFGQIPKGWRAMPFAETVHIISGGTPKTSVAEYWDGEIPWFAAGDAPPEGQVFAIDTEKHITQAGLENSSTRLLPPWTTIVSARGTVGKLAITGREMAMNQSCYGLQSKTEVGATFTYLSTRQLVSTLHRLSYGAIFDTVTRATLRSVEIVRPDEPVLKAFDRLTKPLFERILANCELQATLSALRDTLLPRLISGQLRIPEAQEAVEEALA